MTPLRPIALYLPQFHPIPENDAWWGKGFTEWTNVVKAKPLFEGHYQPHLPADLGFYDLRVEESRIAQAALAKKHGIYGFCYYHYWFNGKQLLERPVTEVLSSGKPDFPFMYCWANENWTRAWDGKDKEVLMKQNYSEFDDIEHIQYLCKNVFSDARYIKVDGKPFFAVYRPGLFPDIKQTLRAWRKEALHLGIGELYIAYVQGFNAKEDPEKMGFDAAIDFQPDFYNSPAAIKDSLINLFLNKIGIKKSAYNNNRIADYKTYVDLQKLNPTPAYKQFPCITPMWDNTARRKDGAYILKNANPKIYEEWLNHILKTFKPYSKEESFIFINAWNEWAEGNHLEPCTKWGHAFLESTKRALQHAT